MSLLSVQWLEQKLHTNRCTHRRTDGALCSQGTSVMMNMADGTSHSKRLLFSLSSLDYFLKSIFKDTQQLEVSWPLISDQTTEGRSTLSLLRHRGLWMRHGVSIPDDVAESCEKGWEGFQASFEFPPCWISKGKNIKRLTVWWQVF